MTSISPSPRQDDPPGAARPSRDTTKSRRREVLLLATLLALGAIGLEHTYHSFVLGVADEHGIGGHLGHLFRDAILAFPLAIAAVAAGLWLGRRYGPVARAGLISGVFGLLLVPSVRLHDVIDNALGSGDAHEHEGHGGLEAAIGITGWLEHGLRDAAVAEIAAVPLMLLGVFLLQRGTSGRRGLRWGRLALVAAVA